jgi:maleylacetoacetate isomerase
MILYDYFRSTACYRVRIALKLKKLKYDRVEVHLTDNGGAQNTPEYREINPQGLVPALEIDGQEFTQSLAIIEYLDELHPKIPLLPEDPMLKAKVRALALVIACDMHPLNNLRVLNQLKAQFKAEDVDIQRWYHHWLKTGFDAIEAHLAYLDRSKPFCLGHSFTLADVCLIPQVFNAKRFHFAMDDYPLISAINEHCLTLDAFQP